MGYLGAATIFFFAAITSSQPVSPPNPSQAGSEKASIRQIRLSLRWVGRSASKSIRVVGAGVKGIRTFDQILTPHADTIVLPVEESMTELTLTAPGFDVVTLPRAQWRQPVTFNALATLQIRLPRPVRATNPPLLVARSQDGRREMRADTSSPSPSVVAFVLPPDRWDVLFDDGESAPAIIPDLALLPGEARSLASPISQRGHAETIRLRPPPGDVTRITVNWVSAGSTASGRLVALWLESRTLRPDASGNVVVDRLPEVPHSWNVRVAGYRPAEVNAREISRAQGDRFFDIALRTLPKLVVSAKSDSPLAGDVNVVLKKITENVTSANALEVTRRGSETIVWRGDLAQGNSVEIPISESGHYRAEGKAAGLWAYGEKDVDVATAENPSLTVVFASRVVRGRVLRGDQPAADAAIRIIPFARIMGQESTTLGETISSADGSYALTVGCACHVYVSASLPDGTRRGGSVEAKEPETLFDIVFRGGTVAVTLRDRSSGRPIPGLLDASFESLAGEHRSETKPTDEFGKASFGDLEDGTLTIAGRAEGHSRKQLLVDALGTETRNLEIDLDKAAPFRVAVRDLRGEGIPNAQVMVPVHPRRMAPRLAPLRSLGVTDGQGELVLEELAGEMLPVYVFAPGFTVQTALLPASADPSADEKTNTLTLTLSPFVSGPGLKVLGKLGVPRRDAILLFVRNGMEIPISVLRQAAAANGLSIESLMQPDMNSEVHACDLLSPGSYVVLALSPGGDAANRYDPYKDVKDMIGIIGVPMTTGVSLAWQQDRPGFVTPGGR